MLVLIILILSLILNAVMIITRQKKRILTGDVVLYIDRNRLGCPGVNVITKVSNVFSGGIAIINNGNTNSNVSVRNLVRIPLDPDCPIEFVNTSRKHKMII